MIKPALFSVTFLSALIAAAPAWAEDERQTLFPDWGRTELADQGYSLDFFAINDYWKNLSGGRKETDGILGNIFTTFEIDSEKAGFWSGGRFSFSGIGIYGRRPSQYVGDYQFTDSIDGPDTYEIWQLWFSQDFWEDRVNLLAGIHDFSMEFAVLSYGISFVNSSFQTPATITQNFYSFYPFTSLGIRARTQLTDEVYALAGVYDGLTTNPNRQRARDWGVSSSDGVFVIGEVGYQSTEEASRLTKLALGGWYTSPQPSNIDEELEASNYGTYLLAERELFRECDDADQGLGALVQIGQANNRVNYNSWYFGAGIRYKGLLPSRDFDTTGIGWTMAQTSSRARQLDESILRNEQAFELFYRFQVRQFLSLVVDTQYVRNPGPLREQSDAVVMFLRTELVL